MKRENLEAKYVNYDNLIAEAKKNEIKECNEPLVCLSDEDFVLYPEYFIKEGWGEEEMRLRESVLEQLKEAQKLLPEGYKFKILDAYRSIDTQQQIYDSYKDDLKKENPALKGEKLEQATQKFVSFPKLDKKSPPPHNTGAAVDLTIVDERGKELDMGTTFDHFGEEAAPDYFAYPENWQGSNITNIDEIKENRRLLSEVMSKTGFSVYPTEWWHWELGTQLNVSANNKNECAKYGSADLLDRNVKE
ncbi:MAG: M15 family metallopeptidase [bacterium]